MVLHRVSATQTTAAQALLKDSLEDSRAILGMVSIPGLFHDKINKLSSRISLLVVKPSYVDYDNRAELDA